MLVEIQDIADLESFSNVFFLFTLHHSLSKMSGSGVWINAIWILLFVTFDVAFSSYSEDQCSWRGRQVFHFIAFLHVAE